MKKFLLPILSVVLIVGLGAIVWAGQTDPGIGGTPHELAPEPCAMCHTPHSGTGDYPLWNRYQDLTEPYQMYDSISFDMGPANNPPRPPSSLCLVCHNGVTSSLVNYPGPCSTTDTAYDLEITGCADLGTDLRDDHPISFTYAEDGWDEDDNGFPPPDTVGTRGRKAIVGLNGTYFLYARSAATPNDNYFECATCHSVHDTIMYDGKGDYQVYFLRADNTGSAMCVDCHVNRY